MTKRYDYGGAGWGVSPELAEARTMLDSKELDNLFKRMVKLVYKNSDYDYTQSVFKSFKDPIRIKYKGREYITTPYDHIMNTDYEKELKKDIK